MSIPNPEKLKIVEQSAAWRKYVYDRVKQDSRGCWIWQGAFSRFGYGVGTVNRIPAYAHRISFFSHFGKPPTQRPIVLHKCNTKACVNPRHLRAGTTRENIFDAMECGAWQPVPLEKSTKRGSQHGRALITEKDVVEIRRLHASGMIHRDIAPKFGITRVTVSNICTRRTWKHV